MKIKIVLAAVVLMSVLTACRKDLTCECTTTGSGEYTDSQGYENSYEDSPETSTVEYKKVKKSRLKTTCGDQVYESTSTRTSDQGITSSNTSKTEMKCKIK